MAGEKTDDTGLNGTGLRDLRRLDQLETLCLDGTRTGDAGLVY